MNKIRIFGPTSVFFVLLIIGCKQCPPPEPKIELTPSKNIVVILDTSDRISKKKYPGQAKRDALIVEEIIDLFAELVRKEFRTLKRDNWLRHRFAIDVPNQPNTAPIPLSIMDELCICPTEEERKKANAQTFKDMEANLRDTVKELWAQIDKQKAFTGSDIWSWFGDSCESYLKKDMTNYIICLSDGYLDFDKSIQGKRRHNENGNKTSYIPYSVIKRFWDDSDWQETFDSKGYGLLEIEADFKDYDVKFLMVEMKLRDVRDNREIIETYWKRWLSSMGITRSTFLSTQSSSRPVKETVNKFLSENNQDSVFSN